MEWIIFILLIVYFLCVIIAQSLIHIQYSNRGRFSTKPLYLKSYYVCSWTPLLHIGVIVLCIQTGLYNEIYKKEWEAYCIIKRMRKDYRKVVWQHKVYHECDLGFCYWMIMKGIDSDTSKNCLELIKKYTQFEPKDQWWFEVGDTAARLNLLEEAIDQFDKYYEEDPAI